MRVNILIAPSANRVYGLAAPRLAAAELEFVLAESAPGALVETSEVREANLDFLALEIDDEAWESPENQRALTSSLAYSPHVYAAFEEVGRMPAPNAERSYVDESPTLPLLQPIPLPNVDLYPSTLLSTLKYQGKTNEQFTALLLHLAAHAAGKAEALRDGTLRVLDPVAGRGTTLNQALMWGLSPVGVDLDKKDAELYRAFLKSWMRENRLKHTTSDTKLTVSKKALGKHFHAELSRSKSEQRAGKGQSLELYTADSTGLDAFLKARSADVIVADLPYGVQHGSKVGANLRRSPLELLRKALPAWSRVLARGGAVALAYNRHTTPADDVHAIVEEHGFELRGEGMNFRHRVDASIDRDIALARKA
ncbi:TRM11 family SAM-dependent methyltransferase [Dermabacter vaginalis]|uniref:Ribosomal RNA large subunit methyltransferase K/L-like methyltransferase domain-containing protein n=1 Tax=Dermabacter vaginalis TaxID=1630135 RepID=A0ABX6A2L4_9MICO|nr:hypothetical protein [Dermabacter vaginalis]QEU11406.1 hypothetical protein FOB48_03235 [Dermabacter vaginalis]